MSIIQVLKNKISSLEKENQQLKLKVDETERDIKYVSSKAVKIFNYIGFSSMVEEIGDKSNSRSNSMKASKVLLKIGKKFMTKQISFKDLDVEWQQIKPIFNKYKHIIQEDRDGNGNS